MIKVYETINDARLVTSVEIDGRSVSVAFVGGAVVPQWRAATFRCEDEALQCALELSTAYGVSYRLKEVTESECRAVELKNVDEVTNKQKAIEWLRQNFDLRFSVAVTPDLLVAAAEERGYIFLNWDRDGK